MSWFGKVVKNVTGGSTGQLIAFDDLQVMLTSQLAEGGYSYVFSAREVGVKGRVFAAKKVLTQDMETQAVAEIETELLKKFHGHPAFVGCYGTTSKELPKRHREYWMLLEFCPNGSLIDLLYRKNKRGEFEKKPPMPHERILEVFEQVAAGVAHMHSFSPPIQHRDLKLENVLCAADGRFVLCDFGSATTERLELERTRQQIVVEEERCEHGAHKPRAPPHTPLPRRSVRQTGARPSRGTRPLSPPSPPRPRLRHVPLAPLAAYTSTRRSCTARQRCATSIAGEQMAVAAPARLRARAMHRHTAARPLALEEQPTTDGAPTAAARTPSRPDRRRPPPPPRRSAAVGELVDCWALGCILFALCFGDHPFDSESQLQILNAAYSVPEGHGRPAQLVQMVDALLQPDPIDRLTAAETLQWTKRLRANVHAARPEPSSPQRQAQLERRAREQAEDAARQARMQQTRAGA
eukprot:3364047-Prymnesium_polylepis.1